MRGVIVQALVFTTMGMLCGCKVSKVVRGLFNKTKEEDIGNHRQPAAPTFTSLCLATPRAVTVLPLPPLSHSQSFTTAGSTEQCLCCPRPHP